MPGLSSDEEQPSDQDDELAEITKVAAAGGDGERAADSTPSSGTTPLFDEQGERT